MDIRFRRKIAPGGFADNLALSAISASAMAIHPAIGAGAFMGALFGAGLAGSGGGWVAKRILDAKYRALFSSEVKINSDDVPPVDRADGMTLGFTVDTGEPVTIPWDDWKRHCFVGGMTGVGKTVFGEWIMLQQIVNGGGLLFIDGKLDSNNLKKLDAMCAWAGRRADLLVINPGNPGMSNSYNPILYGDADEVSSRCLSLIPSSENNPATDYYRQAANQGITTLVGAIQAAGKAYNFIDLSILLSNQSALARLESIVPKGDAQKALALFLEQYKTANREGVVSIDLKRLKEVFGGMAGRLHLFGSGNFGMVTNSYSPEVRLYDAVRQNKIVYVALPTMGKKEAASNFGKMVVGDLRSAVSWVQALPEKDRPNPPFQVFADEAGSYATPAWSVMFEQARSAGIAMMPAVQTMANLDTVSKEFTETLIGNTTTKVIFKIGTDATAEYMSELIGTEKHVALTASTSDGRGIQQDATGSTRKGSSGSDSFGVSEREEEGEKVTSNMLKALGKGEAIVQYDGNKVYHIRVPAVRFTPDFMKEIGEFSLNRHRPSYVPGLDFFRDVQRWLASGT